MQIGALFELEKVIRHLDNLDLVRPGRHLLKRGFLGDMSSSSQQRKYYFFFNDLIVETTPRKSIKKGAQQKYDYVRAAHLTDDWSVKSASQMKEFGFVLVGVHRHSTWVQPSFVASDQSEFNEWIRVLLKYTKKRNTEG